MPKFLIDEALSPLLAIFLSDLGYDAVAVREVGLRGADDRRIVNWVKDEKRCIISCDKDFGEIYYLEQKGKIGVIILENKFQSTDSYKSILMFLHRKKILSDKSLSHSLIISTETRFRKYPPDVSQTSKNN